MISAGHREGPALELDRLDGDHLVGGPAAVVAPEAPHRGRERSADEALLRLGIVLPAHLERKQPGLAEVDGLLELPLGQIPEVEAVPVAPRLDVCGVEPRLVGVRLAELGGDEHVLARLVPEVVVERRCLAAVLPAALDLERLRVEDGEAAGAVSVGVAEHADDDVVAGHAVHRVRPRVAGLGDELVALDHLLDPRRPRVVGDVQDVDPRGAEARHDQMRAVRSVAGGAAAVPAEVVQLVAAVRHRRLVQDPSLLGVHDGEEVGLVDARALVQAGEVQELLRRRLQRLVRRSVERCGLVVTTTPRLGLAGVSRERGRDEDRDRHVASTGRCGERRRRSRRRVGLAIVAVVSFANLSPPLPQG